MDWFGDILTWFEGSWVDMGLEAVGEIFEGTDGEFSFGSVIKGVGSIVDFASSASSAFTDVAGAAAPALESYFAAESIIQNARQTQANYLTQAENFGFQAGIAELNGKIAMENLDYEVQMAFATEQIMERENRKDLGKMQAVYGAAGVTMSGSAIDVIADSAAEGALSVALMNYESEKRQTNIEYQMQANDLTIENYKKAAATAEANADEAIEQGQKSKDLQDIITITEGISAVPNVLGAIGGIVEGIGSLFDRGSGFEDNDLPTPVPKTKPTPPQETE